MLLNAVSVVNKIRVESGRKSHPESQGEFSSHGLKHWKASSWPVEKSHAIIMKNFLCTQSRGSSPILKIS